jgi:hypothetical protein
MSDIFSYDEEAVAALKMSHSLALIAFNIYGDIPSDEGGTLIPSETDLVLDRFDAVDPGERAAYLAMFREISIERSAAISAGFQKKQE